MRGERFFCQIFWREYKDCICVLSSVSFGRDREGDIYWLQRGLMTAADLGTFLIDFFMYLEIYCVSNGLIVYECIHRHLFAFLEHCWWQMRSARQIVFMCIIFHTIEPGALQNCKFYRQGQTFQAIYACKHAPNMSVIRYAITAVECTNITDQPVVHAIT